jgi:hypothetical protein
MKVSELSQSNYLKKEDVTPPVLVTISKVVQEKIKDIRTGKENERWVMYFEELEKGLILNVTQGQQLQGITGSDDSDDWIGGRVVLWNNPEVNNPQNPKDPGGIRIRAPKVTSAAPVPSPRKTAQQEEDDDGLPF